MAVTYRTSVIFGNATSGTEPSGAIAPLVGDLFIVHCAAKENTNGAPTCTDNNGGTYTLIGTATYRTSLDTFSVFVRNQKLINTNSTTVTVTIGAHTNTEVTVTAISGIYLVGAAAILQSAKTDNGTTTPAATFGAAATTTNMTIAAVGYDLSAATLATPPTNWTERQEAGQALGASIELATRDSGFTGTAVTWGNNIGEPNAAYIIELDGTISSINYLGSPNIITATIGASPSAASSWRGAGFPGSGINPIPNYKLSCEDDTGLRHYWVDATISLANAPPGFTYVSATLVVEGKF
jgi:hypothetical protein